MGAAGARAAPDAAPRDAAAEREDARARPFADAAPHAAPAVSDLAPAGPRPDAETVPEALAGPLSQTHAVPQTEADAPALRPTDALPRARARRRGTQFRGRADSR